MTIAITAAQFEARFDTGTDMSDYVDWDSAFQEDTEEANMHRVAVTIHLPHNVLAAVKQATKTAGHIIGRVHGRCDQWEGLHNHRAIRVTGEMSARTAKLETGLPAAHDAA